MNKEEVRKTVRESYAEVARQGSSCCGGSKSSTQGNSCCSGGSKKVSNCCSNSVSEVDLISQQIGYSEEDVNAVPEGANLGLGCGNPVALASLKKGEVVLDLGSGAGFDCFLAAPRVGEEGKVIGVDMTPDMLDRSRENCRKGKYKNVEFRLGEIENLPVADNFVDVIISNCVINLSIDKPRVFKEAFRVLKPGGRLMVSDIVLLGELPKNIKDSIEAYVSCISGAIKKNDYLKAIKAAGFEDVKVVDEALFPVDYVNNDPAAEALVEELGISPEQVHEYASSVASVKVHAVKPG